MQQTDEPVRIRHLDEELTLAADSPVTRAVEYVAPLTARPEQPVGREPIKSGDLDAV